MEPERSRLSLAGRTQVALAGAFLVAAATIVAIVNLHDRAEAFREAERDAVLLLERNLAIHRYFSEQLKPAVFALPGARHGRFDARWMSSTFAVREIDRYVQQTAPGPWYYREAAIDARSPENEADAVERAFIEEARRDPRLMVRTVEREIGGTRYYEVLRRGETMEESCLACHSTPGEAPSGLVDAYGGARSFGRHVGQLVSAISIRIPVEAAYADANAFSLRLSLALVAVLALLFAAQGLIERRLLVTPLARLREAAVALAGGTRGPAPLPLPPHPELRDLTRAFNAMSRAVETHEQELARQVAERTEALVAAHRELERSAVEREHARKVEALGRLAGGVAHDFNNLLTAVNGYAGLLVDGLPEGDPRREDALEVRRAGERAAALTRQLLSFSRRDVAQARVLEPNRVIAALDGMLRRLIPENVAIEADLAPQAGPVLADPGHLEQIVVNLAANARDALPKGGRIRLATRNVTVPGAAAPPDPVAPGRWLVLSVEDDGLGMDGETLAHIFEPFFTTKPRGAGTGLGLATVAALARQSGGNVFAQSAPGKGSAFRVWLPVSEGALAPEAQGAAAPRAPRAARVLVVEDEPLVRRFVVSVLRSAGYEVAEADDGADALRALEARAPDLLVTDLVMPGLDGHQLATRARERRPALAVLFMSGYAPGDDLRDRVAASGDAFLAKPFAGAELLAAVAPLLARGVPAAVA